MKSILRNPSDIDRLAAVLRKMPLPIDVDFREHKSKRSLDQNALYWKWLSTIKEHIYETTGEAFTEDELHDYYRELFLPVSRRTINGIDTKRLTSTTKLTVPQMTEYLQKIDERCIAKMGLMLPTPEDV